MNVEQARKNGLKVNVQHYRKTKRGATVQALKHEKQNVEFSGNGGYTIVTVSDKNDVSTAVSNCSPTDSFNYKMGTKIALSRALAHLDAKKRNRIDPKNYVN